MLTWTLCYSEGDYVIHGRHQYHDNFEGYGNRVEFLSYRVVKPGIMLLDVGHFIVFVKHELHLALFPSVSSIKIYITMIHHEAIQEFLGSDLAARKTF